MIGETAETIPAAEVEQADEVPAEVRAPDALGALNHGAALLEAEETFQEECRACAEAEAIAEITAQERVAAQLDELGAKLRTLTPEGRARFVARMGDAHAAVRLVNELLARPAPPQGDSQEA